MTQFLDGSASERPNAYSSGRIAQECARLTTRMRQLKQKSAWALNMAYFGGVMAVMQDHAVPGVLGDLGFDYRWQHEWSGKNIDLREEFMPLVCS